MAAADTSLWKMNHTMVRVKDPARSIRFYQKLGMVQIDKLSMTEFKFDLFFLAFDKTNGDPCERRLRSDRQGLLEITHNYGSEDDDTFKVSNGNEDPYLGFEHLGVTVPDLELTIQQLQSPSTKIIQQSQDGKATVAIVQDPDGYIVELTQGAECSLNSTGLRIKDPKVSLPWYTDILGMQILRTVDGGDRTDYWVGYTDGVLERDLFEHEGLLKLIWIHGSETKEGKVYHDGNAQPQGFGHLGKCTSMIFQKMGEPLTYIALATENISLACEYFESRNVEFKKRLTDGKLKSIAFILDPDGYWFEVIQNARIKEPLGIQ